MSHQPLRLVPAATDSRRREPGQINRGPGDKPESQPRGEVHGSNATSKRAPSRRMEFPTSGGGQASPGRPRPPEPAQRRSWQAARKVLRHVTPRRHAPPRIGERSALTRHGALRDVEWWRAEQISLVARTPSGPLAPAQPSERSRPRRRQRQSFLSPLPPSHAMDPRQTRRRPREVCERPTPASPNPPNADT